MLRAWGRVVVWTRRGAGLAGRVQVYTASGPLRQGGEACHEVRAVRVVLEDHATLEASHHHVVESLRRIEVGACEEWAWHEGLTPGDERCPHDEVGLSGLQ